MHLLVECTHVFLYRYDIAARSATLLFSAEKDAISVCGLASTEGIDRAAITTPKFLNDLAITPDGTIYLSDTSYKHPWSEKEQEVHPLLCTYCAT
jgi:sugar lactone lactonase YvrE